MALAMATDLVFLLSLIITFSWIATATSTTATTVAPISCFVVTSSPSPLQRTRDRSLSVSSTPSQCFKHSNHCQISRTDSNSFGTTIKAKIIPTLNNRATFQRQQRSKTSTILWSSASTPAITADQTHYKIDKNVDMIVCGGGPAGLLSSIMLARQFPNKIIRLYERREEIPPSPTDSKVWSSTNIADKYYLIGLGGRGITALQKYNVWNDVQAVSIPVPGRKDWTTKISKKHNSGDDCDGSEYDPNNDDGTEKMLDDRKYQTHVLPRDKLVSVLYKHICENYSSQIKLHYGTDLQPLHFNYGMEDTEQSSSSVLVRLVNSSGGGDDLIISTKFLIVADGSARSFVNQMEKEDIENQVDNPIHVTRYVDDQPRIYKSIPFQIPTMWKPNLNYAIRADSIDKKGQPQIIFDALPVGDGAYCGLLLLPEDHSMAKANVDVDKMDQFLKQTIPQLYPYFSKDKIEEIATKPPSTLPKFRYVGPRLHHQDQTVLVGDCIKTLKPYFGLGANSALEDVLVLGNCIEAAVESKGSIDEEESSTLKDAIIEYSNVRASDIKTLVVISHSLDRPGPIGIASFLIPVILDGIFRGLLPQIFAPNIINMLQNEEITFEQAAQRKLYDRIGQIAVLGTLASGLQGLLLLTTQRTPSDRWGGQ